MVKLLATLGAAAILCSCASVSTTTTIREDKNDLQVIDDGYDGPKKRLQVVRFGIPEDVAAQYPELGEKRIGWGLCNLLVDAFWETSRFEFIEEKNEIVQKMFDTWKLSLSGAVNEETAVEPGGLNAPEYLAYAEVYDFSASTSESLTGIAAKGETVTRIGVQIKLVDVETGKYVPASGVGEVAVTSTGTIWAVDTDHFDQSTVGKASRLAIVTAVNKMVKRLDF